MNFIGQNCPVCNKTFEKDSDIVVCPNCGAPHHKQCYNKTGKCFFSEKHGTFTWKAQNVNTSDDNDTHNANGGICVRCNYKNKPTALFCENCGFPIMNVTSSSNGFNSFNKQKNENFRSFNQNTYAGIFNNTSYTSTEPVFEDITAQELAEFVKANQDYYTQAAKRMSVTGKTSFNFSAFMFSGFWLLFRKKYLAGVITIFSFLTLWFTSLIIYSKYTVKTFIAMYSYLGISQNESPSFDMMPQVQNFLQTLSSTDLFLTLLPYFFDIILIIAMITFGVIANRYYIKSCVKQIHKIKQAYITNKEEGNLLKKKLSGVNTSLASYALSIVLLLSVFLRYILIY